MQALIRQPARPLPPVAALHRLDGGAVSLAAYRGKPVLINLWATWCPPCRRELPMLAELAKTSPVPIVFADEGEDAARVRDFLSQQNIPADRSDEHTYALHPLMRNSYAVICLKKKKTT